MTTQLRSVWRHEAGTGEEGCRASQLSHVTLLMVLDAPAAAATVAREDILSDGGGLNIGAKLHSKKGGKSAGQKWEQILLAQPGID